MNAESKALGVAPKERRKRMYEHIRVLKHLWHNDRAEFKGSFHSFSDLVLEPKPVNPNCPIWTATNATRLASGTAHASSSGSDYALSVWACRGRLDDAQRVTARDIRPWTGQRRQHRIQPGCMNGRKQSYEWVAQERSYPHQCGAGGLRI
jgi:hypothetical protein